MTAHGVARLTFALVLGALACVAVAASAAQVEEMVLASPTSLEELSVQQQTPALGHGVAEVGVDESTGPDFSLVINQSFSLAAGWTAIYLEVEPVNDSPLVDPDGPDGDLPPAHEAATIESVFSGLACDGGNPCLDSVWTWYSPLSNLDYIVDPAEGLWDVPGWQRYFPETSRGPDGVSKAFLSDLFSLHANRGYLVKTTAAATLQVRGRPVPRRQGMAKEAYHLIGFPILPGAQPTVGTFTQSMPIDAVYDLDTEGEWRRLAPEDRLAHGSAYLVYRNDEQHLPDPAGSGETTIDPAAPLDIDVELLDGILRFPRRLGSNTRVVKLTGSASFAITLLGAEGGDQPTVALDWTNGPTANGPIWNLNGNTVSAAVNNYWNLRLAVRSAEQTRDGEGILVIWSEPLGVRWLIPVAAERVSNAGLWVGEAVLNDVSEARLGSTAVADGHLTIALPPLDDSGIRGSAEMMESVSGGTPSVQLAVTLDLPNEEDRPIPAVITGTSPYVGGYVFEDANVNGERDVAEAGIEGVTVRLTSDGSELSCRTGADGSYVFEEVGDGEYVIELDPQVPAGHTNVFDITKPETDPTSGAGVPQPNAWPTTVTVGAAGVTSYGRIDYKEGTSSGAPTEDALGNRVEPLLNFGFVTQYDISIWQGTSCSTRTQMVRPAGGAVWSAVNGTFAKTLTSAALDSTPGASLVLLEGVRYVIYVAERDAAGTLGRGVACGSIEEGAPTGGSEFNLRLILRVDEDGVAELLPTYAYTTGERTSSVALGVDAPLGAVGGPESLFGDRLLFESVMGANDPLNPFKHKYHPDHDMLDVQFNPINLGSIAPHLSESFTVTRGILMEWTADPPLRETLGEAEMEELRTELDWGGSTSGGIYKEVLTGIHQNEITVKGWFILRHVLVGEEMLRTQDYD